LFCESWAFLAIKNAKKDRKEREMSRRGGKY